MPVVRIYGIPSKFLHQSLYNMRQQITEEVAAIKELEIDESKITIFFPSDVADHGTHKFEIVGFVDLFKSELRTDEVRRRLAETIGKIVANWIAQATFIEILVNEYDHKKQGYWNLRRPE